MAFQSWMLNGRPSNIEPQVQSVIAVAVTRFHLVVTSTSTGPHTFTSYHFARNNPRHNGKGRASDLAGTWDRMCSFFYWTKLNRRRFDESFGPPNNQFIKRGGLYPGAIPNHYNHNHVAPVFGARFAGGSVSSGIRFGDIGNRVKEVQRRLRVHGFKRTPVTGYFGALTRARVRTFQRRHGLKPDGVVGKNTRALLRRKPR